MLSSEDEVTPSTLLPANTRRMRTQIICFTTWGEPHFRFVPTRWGQGPRFDLARHRRVRSIFWFYHGGANLHFSFVSTGTNSFDSPHGARAQFYFVSSWWDRAPLLFFIFGRARFLLFQHGWAESQFTSVSTKPG